MKSVSHLGSKFIKAVLAMVAMMEFGIMLVADFSNYQLSRAIFLLAAMMTIYCLFRLYQRVDR